MSTLNTTNLKNPSSGSNNIVLATDGSATIATLSSTTITGTTIQGTIKSGTAVASTSGTSIDFTSIPSWVKRITVMFSGVSTNGTSQIIFQLGDSGGIETSSYTGAGAYGSASTSANSSGFLYADTGSINASYSRDGLFTFCNLTSNTWAMSGVSASSGSTNAVFYTAGSKSLSSTLDRVRITTVGGSDTFDAGTINLLWEG
jgi:hypothetical protein